MPGFGQRLLKTFATAFAYDPALRNPSGEAMMLALQVKAFSLLIAVLLIVDAIAFHGEYRGAVGEKLGAFFSTVSPTHWSGMGGGRDWSQPKH